LFFKYNPKINNRTKATIKNTGLIFFIYSVYLENNLVGVRLHVGLF
jgi:hypothetical protein